MRYGCYHYYPSQFQANGQLGAMNQLWSNPTLSANSSLIQLDKRDFDRHWSLKGVVGYKRLLGDADASPLVDGLGSEHQFQFGVGLAYKF